MSSLEKFIVEPPKAKNVYVTIQPSFEKYCKGCNELLNSECQGQWVRVFCKSEKCVKSDL